MSRYIPIDKENNIRNNENIHIANKERPLSSSSKRIPLGGKNQNINKIPLNRSSSSINNKIQPPALNKSNSSLGFISKPLIQPKPRKRVIPQSLDDLSYTNAKRQKTLITNDTDSLIKPEIRPKSAIDSLSSTFSNYTELNAPAKPMEYYSVDPIKRQTTKRQQEIDSLVNKHWKDEIEYIPEKEDLKYFSTPNNSDEYSLLKNNSIGTTNVSLDLSFGDDEEEEEVGEIPIQDTDFENIGLSKEDLNNLLD
ncbi:unnamed protein product [Candida verbasci]|uniref:Securin n=1 Tax=Candida verbasci TaxID=1227364 RepID=A0A9W4TZN6_9ASCO|nr:unnamed protein product [Candida verbasci]